MRLLGWTSDDEVVRRYEAARAVLYTPYDEDYGYVTLQAFAAGKPVVTTTDAGAVLEWVTDGVNGLVADPTPKSLAAAIDRIATDDVLTQRLGKRGAGARRVALVGAGRRGAAHWSDGAMRFPRLGVVTGRGASGCGRSAAAGALRPLSCGRMASRACPSTRSS